MTHLVKRLFSGLLVLAYVLLCLPVPSVHATVATGVVDTTEMSTDESNEQPEIDDQTSQLIEPLSISSATTEVDAGAELTSASKTAELLKTIDDNQTDDLGQLDQLAEDSEDVPLDNLPQPVQYYGLVITRVQLQAPGVGGSSLELIELRNNSSEPIDITNWGLYYTKAVPDSNTKLSSLAEFTPSGLTVGMRLVVEPGAYLLFVSNEFMTANPDFESSGVFKTALANSGGRLLITNHNGQLVSGLAWGAATTVVEGEPVPTHDEGFLLARKWLDYSWHQDSKQNSIDFTNDVPIGGLYHVDPIIEKFDACLNIEGVSDAVPDEMYRDEISGNCSSTPPEPLNNCQGLIISEVGANLEEQFIELYNSSDQPLFIGGCIISSDHSTSTDLVLGDITLEPGQYYTVELKDTKLRIYKTSASKVYLLSQDGLNEVDQTEYSDLKPDTSWALINNIWRQTYALTTGAANQYLAYPPCDDGYIRNLETGRCNKPSVDKELSDCNANQFRNPETGRCKLIATASNSLTPCKPGQYRNPETNRCKSLTASTSTLVPCDSDEYRNPATNRCRSIVSTASTLKACEQGWERNPETNRCRKIRSAATVAGADFPVEPVTDTAKVFVGWWALGGVMLLGLGYAGWEWRYEIIQIFRPKS